MDRWGEAGGVCGIGGWEGLGNLVWKPALELMPQLSVSLLFMSLEAFYDGNVV